MRHVGLVATFAAVALGAGCHRGHGDALDAADARAADAATGDATSIDGSPDDASADASAIDASAIDASAIDARVLDASPDASLTPMTLDDTGLCVDAACTQIAAGVRAFAPRWTLWSDGETKRRWIYLPPGTQIDTADMNNWHFPVGTRLWKEFTRAGIRIETRLYWKQGPSEDDWYQVAFVWNASQDQAIATPAGVYNVNGTPHDVPSRDECKHCHERTEGRILGFSALQLDWDAPATDLDLADLVAQGALTAPPTTSGSGPYFPLWPDASANDVAALGYLHANCGHCHNAGSDVYAICPRIFKLDVGQRASKASTFTYSTTVNQTPSITVSGATFVVSPTDPDHSALLLHFIAANGAERMPPIATELVDPTGEAILRDWIAQMN
ncbi:MAG: hypothetical protein K8W52_43475 [Deltaproteobacteria bacterium]|nr:hypothetical protein [Deltaproteobacteria bacterium]